MRNKLWYGIGLLALIAAGAGSAVAADLGVRKAPPPVAPVYLSDWAGFYIGVNGGYGWGNTSFTGGLTEKPKGGLFGGHAGYNWQYGQIVGGVEVDFDGADIKATAPAFIGATRIPGAVETKFDELATARARLGYLVLPNLLAYGTAGPGWGHSDVTATALNGTTLSETGATNFGWTAGAGLEYKIWDHVTVRAEYLHYDFAKENNATTRIDAVRGGLSYKF